MLIWTFLLYALLCSQKALAQDEVETRDLKVLGFANMERLDGTCGHGEGNREGKLGSCLLLHVADMILVVLIKLLMQLGMQRAFV